MQFGEPFKVGEMDLEEANEKLYNEILNIIKKEKNIKWFINIFFYVKI